jgi:hypothetical protein
MTNEEILGIKPVDTAKSCGKGSAEVGALGSSREQELKRLRQAGSDPKGREGWERVMRRLGRRE